MFVYFYNSFQSGGIPVYLGKSTCLSVTYLRLPCFCFQEGGSKEGLLGILAPSRWLGARGCSRVPSEHAAWQKLRIPFTAPASLRNVAECPLPRGGLPSQAWLRHGSCQTEYVENIGGICTMFRLCSQGWRRCAESCAQEGVLPQSFTPNWSLQLFSQR